jgi:hypothetical protein
MRYHATDIPVQMAGTACLYNLLKGELSKAVHVRHLGDIVDHILEVMTNLLNRQQVNTLFNVCLVGYIPVSHDSPQGFLEDI